MKSPLFAVFEGTDGAGKTSLRKRLYQRLRENDLDVLAIIQASWLDIGATEVITRARFLGGEMGGGYAPTEITRAYVADKEALTRRIIRPHLVHRNVIGDRFVASDIVYHEVLFGIDPETTYTAYLSSHVQMPDLQVFVDTPPSMAISRLDQRPSDRRNPWDTEAVQTAVHERFREIFTGGGHPGLGPMIRIDNSGPLEVAFAQLEELVVQPIVRAHRRGSTGPARRTTPTTRPTDPPLRVEDGWALIADGLHIHRYFLHAAGLREARELDAYDAYRQRRPQDALPPLSVLRSHLRCGVLEHLFHPEQPGPIGDLVASGAALRSTVEICGVPIVVACDERRVRAGTGAPLEAGHLFADAPPMDQTTAAAVSRLCEATGLSYLVRLAVDVVIDRGSGPPPEPHSEVEAGGPEATIALDGSRPPVTLAEQLLVEAGASLLALFIPAEGHEPTEPVQVPGRPEPASARSAAFEIFAVAVGHRYLSGLRLAPDTLVDADHRRLVEDRLDAVTRRASELGPIVYDVAASFGNVMVNDLIGTFFPGPRQFEKYTTGAGAGQGQ